MKPSRWLDGFGHNARGCIGMYVGLSEAPTDKLELGHSCLSLPFAGCNRGGCLVGSK